MKGWYHGVKNKLKEIRMREYMMNQKEFCAMLGISQSTYNPIEKNIKQGNAETLLIIAEGLNRKVEDIWYLCD
ncbi:helix-turn-helix transcriptional regulator [Clostridium sp. UBA2485]|uniref:helix-turn-helix transcriptional regulator n=1 Tax=Clostridium sp. UBA2485 TaxID=1946352 RepID=UPI0025C2427F|nr:helix-turn-helix transcriptional regulator [Clostridium sp. UBA2485]